jgi:uncharacterized DUF497 family protein
LEFEWDEVKNQTNLAKHGINFEEAAAIFYGIALTVVDDRQDYGEPRNISIGQLPEHVVVVVIHTDRVGVIRIISARSANRAERRRHDAYCKKITQ